MIVDTRRIQQRRDRRKAKASRFRRGVKRKMSAVSHGETGPNSTVVNPQSKELIDKWRKSKRPLLCVGKYHTAEKLLVEEAAQAMSGTNTLSGE